MKAVNLLPREAQTRSSFSGVDPVVGGGAALTAVVLAIVGGSFALAHSHASSAQSQLAAAKVELAQLQREQTQSGSVATPILPTPTVTAQTPTWEAAVQSALTARVAWDDFLSQIGRVVPGNVNFTTLTLGGTGGSMTIAGTAFNEDSVAEFLSRLQLVPNLSGITLTSSTADPKSGVVTFIITATTSIPATPTNISATPAAGGSGA